MQRKDYQKNLFQVSSGDMENQLEIFMRFVYLVGMKKIMAKNIGLLPTATVQTGATKAS